VCYFGFGWLIGCISICQKWIPGLLLIVEDNFLLKLELDLKYYWKLDYRNCRNRIEQFCNPQRVYLGGKDQMLNVVLNDFGFDVLYI